MTVNPNSQQSVCITRFVEDSSQMIFLYQGRQGKLFVPPLDFIRLSGAASRSIGMFRDYTRSHFHGPIHDEWPDVDAAITNQRDIFNSCAQAVELYCAGTSSGAYSALLFGHYLKADIVYAFGAPTLIEPVILNDIMVDVPPDHCDLSLLLADWNGKTRYRLYYSRNCERDRLAAERIAHCPGVELVPLPGTEHNVFRENDAGKLLTGLFPDQLPVAPREHA